VKLKRINKVAISLIGSSVYIMPPGLGVIMLRKKTDESARQFWQDLDEAKIIQIVDTAERLNFSAERG